MFMKIFALRLNPGQDLREELENFVKNKNINSGFILTCVGSLKKAGLRMAKGKITEKFPGPFEIISMEGTLCSDGIHVHVCLSDKKGNCIGGHLKEGCIVFTTVELVIGASDEFEFGREVDKSTGFEELVVKY